MRDALVAGDPGTATHLLTRPFAIEGRVEHGDKVGRQLGYPTANLVLGPYLRPKYGIYAVRVRLDDGREVAGVANVGVRPSFDPPKELVEAYLFDFAEDLYGRVIEVGLVAFLRGEERFEDMGALTAQMDVDADRARAELA